MEAWITIAVLVLFAGAAWWAKNEGAKSQAILDELADAELNAEIKETSRESAEVADSRRDPVVHDVPDIVPADRIPDWLKRR